MTDLQCLLNKLAGNLAKLPEIEIQTSTLQMALIREETYDIVGQVKPEKPKPKEWVKPLWFLFSVGWYVALSVAIPTVIGFWLDRPNNFDSHPRLALVGFGVGTVIAFYGLYRMLRRFYTEQKEQDKGQGLK